MSLPTFLIIGAMKAGTTSLHHYLSLHPEIFMSKEKELNFFCESLNWNKGVDWYKEQFDESFSIRGEASPNYTKWTGTASRVYSILPDVKLIYVLRDPVKRFVSHCNHLTIDPNTVVARLKQGKQSDIFNTSLYCKWYREYEAYFKKENILIITAESLRENQEVVLNKVFRFLGADSSVYNFHHEFLNNEAHNTAKKEIAGNLAKQVNSNKTMAGIKQNLNVLKPLIYPLWKKFAYKDRVIHALSEENKSYLKQAYSAEMKALSHEFDVNYI